MNIPFLKDPTLIAILNAAVQAIGEGASAPYASDSQPVDINAANMNPFLNFQLPGGGVLTGYAGAAGESIGASINSLLGIFAPFLSAYSLILPILGVIRGILEVICALMNPFSVGSAVERLFKKWVPPLLALYPPLAGVLMILNIIKLLIAVALFVITVVIPTIELIIVNIQAFAKLNAKQAIKQKAVKDKLNAVIAEIKNQLVVLGLIQPILDILQAILRLIGGKPCQKGQKKSSKTQASGTQLNFNTPLFNPDEDDSSCCDDNVCPPILVSPPSGTGTLQPTSPITGFTFKLTTNNSNVANLVPYFVNIPGQSNGAINDPPPPPMDISDGASLKVQLTTSRGLQIVVPILRFADGNQNLIISSSLGGSFVGKVTWSIIPDYNILIFKNIIGLACSPTIASVRDQINNRFPDLELSVVDKFPELDNFNGKFGNYTAGINQAIADLNTQVQTAINTPVPFDPTKIVNNIQSIRNNVLTNSDNFINTLKGNLSNVIAGSADNLNTGLTFKVSPPEVKADGTSFANISIIITDITGAKLSANVPQDITFPVLFETDLGVISNQTLNSATGEITATISSNEIGVANIKASINGVFVLDYNAVDQTQSVSVRTVNFVADAELPARRFISSETGNKFGSTNNKEPGK